MMMNKKCMKCGKSATHKFVRMEGGQIFDLFFCQEHAAERSVYQKPKMPLAEMFANFLNQEQAQPAGHEGESGLKCRTCGLPFSSYRKTLFLGCPDCYQSFFQQLVPELRKFHGSAKHVGSKPGGGLESSEMPPTPLTGAPKGGGMITPVEPETEAGAAPKSIPALFPENLVFSSPDDEPDAEADLESEIEDVKAELAGEIADLTIKLKRAITQEDFDAAAKHRDEIAELKNRLKNL